MASVIKVDELRSQANGSALSIASGGAITVNNGLSGTLSGTISSSTVFPAGGTGNPISIAVICDKKDSGTNGGGFTLGAWRTRDLNTEISDPDSIVTISSNQFTLSAGTYLISWSCPAYYVGQHVARLYDVTNTTGYIGTSEYAGSGLAIVTRSTGEAIVTPSGSNVYEIQHQSTLTKTTNGFGAGHSHDENIYSKVVIYKLK